MNIFRFYLFAVFYSFCVFNETEAKGFICKANFGESIEATKVCENNICKIPIKCFAENEKNTKKIVKANFAICDMGAKSCPKKWILITNFWRVITATFII